MFVFPPISVPCPVFGQSFIVLQPLQDLERNGLNLQYHVWWRRKDSGEQWNSGSTPLSSYVVHNTDTYVPYEIRIQASNEFGPGPESNVVIGYSGEDSEYYYWRR